MVSKSHKPRKGKRKEKRKAEWKRPYLAIVWYCNGKALPEVHACGTPTAQSHTHLTGPVLCRNALLAQAHMSGVSHFTHACFVIVIREARQNLYLGGQVFMATLQEHPIG